MQHPPASCWPPGCTQMQRALRQMGAAACTTAPPPRKRTRQSSACAGVTRMHVGRVARVGARLVRRVHVESVWWAACELCLSVRGAQLRKHMLMRQCRYQAERGGSHSCSEASHLSSSCLDRAPGTGQPTPSTRASMAADLSTSMACIRPSRWWCRQHCREAAPGRTRSAASSMYGQSANACSPQCRRRLIERQGGDARERTMWHAWHPGKGSKHWRLPSQARQAAW
jgi:hypothetical protein